MRTLLVLIVLATQLSAQNTWTDKTRQQMADEVRQEFLHAWQGYKHDAWGHDELRPLTRTSRDWYGNTLLMTPIDALDTMRLMGLKDEERETREYIATHLSLDQDVYVKNFEITIRLLGALLSNYQSSGDHRLLMLSNDLGKRLLPVFDSPTGMPYVYVNLKTGKVKDPKTNPAEIGTLLLEFGTLSKLTGNPVFYAKAKKALVAVYDRRSSIGLVGSEIDVESGKWTDATSHISGGIDSYYEYLLKASILFGDKDCERMWLASQTAIQKYLADQRADGLWYRQVNMDTGAVISTRYGALDAFFPAVLVLAGDLEHAQSLQDSSYKMWTNTGIEPEEFDYVTSKVTSAGYQLRPEIIESAYYLYSKTHDPKYLDQGKTFFEAIKKYCRTPQAYAALSSVETKQQRDSMESFFLAETLKYLYLLYAPEKTVDLKKVVFNTEAHPLQRTW